MLITRFRDKISSLLIQLNAKVIRFLDKIDCLFSTIIRKSDKKFIKLLKVPESGIETALFDQNFSEFF